MTFGDSNDVGGKWLLHKDFDGTFNGPARLPYQAGKGQWKREMKKALMTNFSVLLPQDSFVLLQRHLDFFLFMRSLASDHFCFRSCKEE